MDDLTGLENVITEIVRDMNAEGEDIPRPLSKRRFSGEFNLRFGETLHRRLAVEAAEEEISINQLIARRADSPTPADQNPPALPLGGRYPNEFGSSDPATPCARKPATLLRRSPGARPSPRANCIASRYTIQS